MSLTDSVNSSVGYICTIYTLAGPSVHVCTAEIVACPEGSLSVLGCTCCCRVEMTLKQLKAGWHNLDPALEEGSTVRGRVKTVEGFGVFVQLLEANVTGMAHVSELADDFVKAPADLFKPGQGPDKWRLSRVDCGTTACTNVLCRLPEGQECLDIQTMCSMICILLAMCLFICLLAQSMLLHQSIYTCVEVPYCRCETAVHKRTGSLM